MFDAVLIEKSDSGQEAGLSKIDTSRLPQGDVLVDVAWSTLNYKDALAITGASPVVRSSPGVREFGWRFAVGMWVAVVLGEL